MKVAGVWRCVYWVVDEHGQVIVSQRRDIAAARRFFAAALAAHQTRTSPTGHDWYVKAP